MTGCRLASSMPVMMRTRMWRRTERANLEKKPSMSRSHRTRSFSAHSHSFVRLVAAPFALAAWTIGCSVQVKDSSESDVVPAADVSDAAHRTSASIPSTARSSASSTKRYGVAFRSWCTGPSSSSEPAAALSA